MYSYCKYIQLSMDFKVCVVSGDSIHEVGDSMGLDVLVAPDGVVDRKRRLALACTHQTAPQKVVHATHEYYSPAERLQMCHVADLQTTIVATVASRLHKRGGLAAPCIVDLSIRIGGCKHDAPSVCMSMPALFFLQIDFMCSRDGGRQSSSCAGRR